ncbi:MAG: adenosine deaminase [candidate division KSB1 bacterium]|nr:adenosine deaminase [candidate division KSB1 bacterium]
MNNQHKHLEITRDFLFQLPKTDLHVHLDGSLRPETVADLARKQNVDLPCYEPKDVEKLLTVQGKVDNLGKYIEKFDITLSVLQTEEALRRTAYELAEDAAAENIRYMEVRYSPILHQEKGLDLNTIVDAVLDGLHEAEKKFNIRTGVIICGIRSIHPETSLMLAELAVSYKGKGVVAFDLAGVEYNYPAKDHIKAFYHVRNNNINCTLHAGEAFGPASIHQAIHYCGAHRIGHGTRLIEDEDLLNYVRDHRIPLEICLTSNVQTQSVPSIEAHPFKYYLEKQLRVTLNTDNRLISGTTMTDELWLAVQTFHLSFEQITKVILNGFKSVFLPFDEKVEIYQKAKAEIFKLAS